RGLLLQPHQNCDPLRLEFDSNLFLQEFCKTQYAPIEVHVQIVNLLRHLEPEFSGLRVDDEGEYWSSSDLPTLRRHLDACFLALDKHLESNPNMIGPVRGPDGRILDLVSRQ